MCALIFLPVFCIAIWAVIRGLRGRRVGGHPICRKCGFDLFGNPGALICGECGIDLTKPGHVVIGHLQRQTGLVLVGLAVLFPILFIAGGAVWVDVSNTNWLKYAPTSWLIARAESGNAATRSPALAELDSRAAAGTIGARDLTALINTGLKLQADTGKTWDPAWGDFLETCESNGKLSEMQWKQYASQVWVGMFDVRVRPKVRRGDPVAWWIGSKLPRQGSRYALLVEMKDWRLEWADPNQPARARPNGSDCVMTSCFSFGSDVPPERFPPHIPDGVQQVRVVATVKVGPADVSMQGRVKPVWEGTVDLPGSFTLLPANAPTVAIVNDRGAADRIYRSLMIKSILLAKQPMQTGQVDISVKGPPVGLSFDVFFRQNGGETRIGSFACPAQTNQNFNLWNDWPTGVPGKADVILRTNPSAATDAVNTFEAWQGEFIFKDVPVK